MPKYWIYYFLSSKKYFKNNKPKYSTLQENKIEVVKVVKAVKEVEEVEVV